MQNLNGYIINLLNVYTPETRFLKKFSLSDKTGYAEFNVRSAFYSSIEELGHLTAVQMQICINQLLFVFISALGKYDKLFAEHGYDMDYINKFQNNNTFNTRQSYNFHKRIDTSQVITAKMTLVKEKLIRDLLIMDIEFEFNDHKLTGCVRIAIKME